MERERVSPELTGKGKKVLARFNTLRKIGEASHNARQTAIEEHGKDVTAIIFRGEPPFIYDFFYAKREQHDIIPAMKTLYEKRAIVGTNPSVLEENDLFAQKFRGGLSLIDIENMEIDPQTHELAPEDIRRINRIFRSGFRIGKNQDQMHMLANLICFTSQQWTHPHPEIGVPTSLKKFHENITAYFDYYTSFLTDFKRDPLNETNMLLMLVLGKPSLSMAIGTYAVGKLNITPSSAIKLYKQRKVLASDISLKWRWGLLEKSFLPVFKQAYRNDALPEDLERYQHYSEEIDRAAAEKLLSYMQKTSTAEQQLQNKDEAENLLRQWNKHKRDVRREVTKDPKKRRLEYQISEDYPAEKITMIRNRDTFIFIMHFSDNTHLTLELDKTGRLFGVPPSLLRRYPHVGDTFIMDLLMPILEKYKPKDAPVFQISAASLKPPIADDLEVSEEVPREVDQEIKPPKRRRLIPALTVFESQPLPPITPLAPKVERFVSYSEDQIIELLGPQVSRKQSVVDQVFRAISNFEQGHTKGLMLQGDSRIRIRAGDYRIIMDILGGGNYSIRAIVNRKDAY
jgi:hypothetical protein